MEILHWLQDLSQYIHVSRRRSALRRPGRGTNYTATAQTTRQIVERLHPHRMKLRVIEIIEETPSTKTLRFERTDGLLPPFRPGQYVNLFADVDGVLTSRPYSISSAPRGANEANMLDLTVRDKPGGFVASFLLNVFGSSQAQLKRRWLQHFHRLLRDRVVQNRTADRLACCAGALV